MTKRSNDGKNNFLYPKGSYHGEITPNNPNKLVFNANLQEFAQKVSYICALETNGKISTKEAYDRIKELWHQLKTSKKQLLDRDDVDGSL